jgi:hypothetical protein
VQNSAALPGSGSVTVGQGASLDEPLPGDIRSEEPPAQDTILQEQPEVLAAPETGEKPKRIDGYLDISFERLSNYRYEYPDPDDPNPPKDQIPEAIRSLDGKKVAVRGFMLPVKQVKGRVVEFLLMKDQSACCFGVMPEMNEWIHVICPPGKTAPMVWDIPTTVFGTLEVGEVYEKKMLMSIYRMKFDKLIEPVR